MDYLAVFGPIAPYVFFTAIALLFTSAALVLRCAIKHERELAAQEALEREAHLSS